jgi:hypothetical protein
MDELFAPLPGIFGTVVASMLLFALASATLCCGLPALRVLGNCFVGTTVANGVSSCCKRKKVVIGEDGGEYELVGADLEALEAEEAEAAASTDVLWVTPLVAADASQKPQLAFHDKWAVIVLLLNTSVVTSLAVFTFKLFNFADTVAKVLADNNNPTLIGNSIRVFGICAVIGIIFGSLLLSAFVTFPELMMKTFLLGTFALFVVGGGVLYGVTDNNIGVPCAMGVVAVYWLYFYGTSLKKLPFSSAVLSAGASAVRQNYFGVLTVSLLLFIVEALWTAVCVTAYYGISQYYLYIENRSVPLLVIAYFMLSQYWTAQALKSIMQCTVGGVVGTWWFHPGSSSPVRGSFFRSCTVLSGQLCFGALFVAAIQTVGDVVNVLLNKSKRKNQRYSVRSLVSCILGRVLKWIEYSLKYFNKYSFCYVAAYGTPFMESGKKVSNLFYNRGWTAIVNDNFVSGTLTIGMILTVCVMSGIGYLVGRPFAIADQNAQLAFAAAGGLIGYAVSIVVLGVVESAVAMVFVCLAESPHSLQINHPDTYAALDYTWALFHPTIHDWRIPPAEPAQAQSVATQQVAPVSIVANTAAPVKATVSDAPTSFSYL